MRIEVTTPLGVIPLEGVFGDRPKILAINGIGATDEISRLPLLVAPHYDGIVASIPGDRSPALTETSIEAFAQAFDVVVEFLGPTIVLGLSTGALISLAMRSEKILAVVAVEPPLKTEKIWPFFPELLAGLKNRYRPIVEAVFGMTEFGIKGKDYTHLLEGLHRPTDVVVGGEPLFPKREVSRLPSLVDDEERRLLAAHPLVTLHVAPGAGHNIPHEAPQVLLPLLRRPPQSLRPGSGHEPEVSTEEFFRAAPLVANAVLEIDGPSDELRVAYSRINPIADYRTTASDAIEDVRERAFDLVILRSVLRTPQELTEKLTICERKLRAGGHILFAVRRDIGAVSLPNLRLIKTNLVNSPTGSVFAGLCVAVGAADPVCERLLVHFRYMAMRFLDIRTTLPTAQLARDPKLIVSGDDGRTFRLGMFPGRSPRVVVTQRPLADDQWPAITAALIRSGWVSVIEFDDHPNFTYAVRGETPTERTWEQFALCHAVQVSTQELADAIVPHNPNIVVFPNCVFDLPPFLVRAGAPKVFYGAVSRGRYAVEVARSLKASATNLPDVEFWVAGEEAVFQALPTQNKRWLGNLSYADYLDAMRECDICLSPLEAVPHIDTKSDAKFLDASRNGLAIIASPIVYERTVRHNETGLIAHQLEDWDQMLSSLLRNKSDRVRLAKAAWSYVREERMFLHQAERRREWYLSLWDRRAELTDQLLSRAPKIRGL